MKSIIYSTIIAASKETRAAELKLVADTAKSHQDASGTLKKGASKILAALIIAGDCQESEIRDTAKEITQQDIRDVLQGVYELRVVFAAIVAKTIDLSEEDFDKIEHSKLALLSPFIQDPKYADKLVEAVEMLKTGTTATKLRELKGIEKKEPKAVKEQREKAEAAEAKATQAEERAAAAEARAKAIEETYTVKCQFAITDLKSTATPILESDQLRNRLKRDLIQASDSGNEESLIFQKDKLAMAFFGSCELLGVDPIAAIKDLAAELATVRKGKETAATSTIEVPAIAA